MVSNEEIKRMLDAKRRGVDVEKIKVGQDKIKVGQDKFKICPHCKTRNPEKTIFCENCGKKLEDIQTNKCPSCNQVNPVDAKFCVNCGHSLKKPEQEIEEDKVGEVNEESETVPSAKLDEPGEDIEKNEIPTVKIPTSIPEHAIISKTGTKKTCPACNGKNLKNAKFCVVCGEKFEEDPNSKETNPGQTHEKELETPADTNTDNTITSTDDPVEKIKKAKELLDIGAITSEEFEEIKSKYLKLI